MRFTMAAMKTGGNYEQALRFAKSNGFGAMVNTEMDPGGKATMIPTLKRVMGADYEVHSKDRGDYSRECPITLRKQPHVKSGKFNLWQLSANVPDRDHPGWGNPRWLTELWFTMGHQQVVLFGTHYVAGVQGPEGGLVKKGPFWDAYVQNIFKTEQRLSRVMDENPHAAIVLMGDLNVIATGEGRTDQHTPNRMFGRLGMRYLDDRAIYIAYKNLKMTRHQIIKPGTRGWPVDHALVKAWLD